MEFLSPIWLFLTQGENSIFSLLLISAVVVFVLAELRWCFTKRAKLLKEGFFSDNLRDDLIWTLIPAFVLLVLTQVKSDTKSKQAKLQNPPKPQVESSAKGGS